MANTDSKFGLKPVKYLSGAPWDGKVRWYVYPTNATAMFIGDPVKLGGTAETTGVFPTIALCAAGGGAAAPILGVAVAFRADPPNNGPASLAVSANSATIPRYEYCPANFGSNMYVAVVDDPNVIFEGQITTVAATDMGSNVNIVVGSGSATTGLSGTGLNGSAIATTATHDCKLLGLSEDQFDTSGNALGAYAKVLVTINNHQFKGGVAGL